MKILSSELPLKNPFYDFLKVMNGGYLDVKFQRQAVRTIMGCYKKRKFDRKLLLIEMKPHSAKIIKVQARARGWYARRRWMPRIKEAVWNKQKQEIGLKKVKDGLEDDFDDELNELTDFFHDEKRVKVENFDKKLILPDNEEMKEMLNILNRKPKASLPPLKQKTPVIRQNSDNATQNRFSSEINPRDTGRAQNSSKGLSDLNRKIANNNDYMTGGPDAQFFHGGEMQRDRSPSSISGALTEIDLRNDLRRRDSDTSFNNNNQPVMNNLMNQSRGSFTGSQATIRRPKITEQKRQYIESWGIQNEDTKKIIEARFMKMNKMKNKKKKLTADDRLKMFRKQSRRAPP
jgi:hypothetical protein